MFSGIHRSRPLFELTQNERGSDSATGNKLNYVTGYNYDNVSGNKR